MMRRISDCNSKKGYFYKYFFGFFHALAPYHDLVIYWVYRIIFAKDYSGFCVVSFC